MQAKAVPAAGPGGGMQATGGPGGGSEVHVLGLYKVLGGLSFRT